MARRMRAATIDRSTLIGKGKVSLKSARVRARGQIASDATTQPRQNDPTGQVHRFLEELERNRRSAHTLRGYRSDLDQLLAWLERHCIAATDINRDICRLYGSDLAASGAAPATIARKLGSLKSFVRFLAENGAAPAGCADGVKAPDLEKRLPSVLSAEEVQRLFAAASEAISSASLNGSLRSDFRPDFQDDFQGEIPAEICAKRDLALLELLYDCGLRSAEAVGLRLEDLRRDRGLLIVHGKGNKTRLVPYLPATLAAIDQWLAVRPSNQGEESATLLTSINGRALSTADVRRIVARAGQRAGIAVHPHGLRHACATHLMEEGADIRMIQEFLGHASISTTQIYTRVSETQLKRVYLAAHPRAKED